MKDSQVEALKKLCPELQAMARLILEHDESMRKEGREQERANILKWLNGQKDFLSGGSLEDWTDELINKLKALPAFIYK